MTVTKIAPSLLASNVDDCDEYLDAIRSLAELMSKAAAADVLSDAIAGNPKLLADAWGGIFLLAKDAQHALHVTN